MAKTKITKTEAKRRAEALRIQAVSLMGAVAAGNKFSYENLLAMGGSIALEHVVSSDRPGENPATPERNAMMALLTAKGDYRPTLRADINPEMMVLADIYDFLQARSGDPRRAYRG